MIARYTRPEMGKLWSDEHRFQTMLEVELLACEALMKLGVMPAAAHRRIRRKVRVNVARIARLESKTRHDVMAFLDSLTPALGKDSAYLHLGLTSSDVLDTALAVLLCRASDLLMAEVKGLLAVLRTQARRYKRTVMIGRSHGVHAEPTTFGLKLALFYEEMQRNLVRLAQAKEGIRVGKISGAVGTYAHVDPRVERYVCRELGLEPDAISTQVIQRDRHAAFLTTLAVIGSSLEKIAMEVRNLQRTETREVEEAFLEGQKGSSAMPHKRNPVVCERITGLSRVLRANAMAALENVALWHERDISHSSVERIILPDSTILLDYLLALTTDVVRHLLVYPSRMRENLEKTGGLIFSGRLLVELAKRGMSRDRAYRAVQRCAMESWRNGRAFQEIVLRDRILANAMTPKEIRACFDLGYHLRHVDRIFRRVGI